MFEDPEAAYKAFRRIELSRDTKSGRTNPFRGPGFEGAGEIGLAGRGRFVGENAGVELLRQPAPVVVHAFDAIGEVESLVIHLDAQMHGLAGGNGDGRREGVGLRRVRQRRTSRADVCRCVSSCER